MIIAVLAILALLAVSYVVGYMLIKGVPESLSATYYALEEKGWVLQAFLMLMAAGLYVVWLPIDDGRCECLVFLTCASLAFVAAAPAFRIEIQSVVHYSAAVVCCVSVFLWQILEDLWDVTLWFVWIGGMLTLANRSKWCWWLECAAIGSLLANLWRLV